MKNKLNWEDYLPVGLLIGANCAKALKPLENKAHYNKVPDMPKKFCNHDFTKSHHMANREIVEASQEDKKFLEI